jgi:DNA-binding CsgD family transcriptional regulator
MALPPPLRDRDAERATLDRLLDAVRRGEGRALVVHGEAGVGKSALLEYLAQTATGCRVVRAAGAEYEMELAYAGLHQLCGPLIELREHLPRPQRDALSTAFGLSDGPPPDRFLVGLAVLSLLADAAEAKPLVCIVDDAQWLDRVSAETLAFVARRLLAERVGVVFGRRSSEDGHALAGLPELWIDGLADDDARSLLDATIPGPLDARVRTRILAESRGNPLALLELPRGLTPGELAGGFGLSGSPLASRIEQSFLRRLKPLPVETRQLLLTAAAEPFGDVRLLWRAADRLGLGPEAVAPAEAAGLLQLGAVVRFRHPLVRSAVYRTASIADRQAAHRALAEAIDDGVDLDRRAWHRAQAAPGPDEDVAAELVRSADRAQGRGGIAAAAAFLERAAALTQDPARRTERGLDAAQAKLQAGAFEPAAGLLAMAEAGQLDELGRARVDQMRAQIAFAQGRGSEAPPLLLTAARRLERLDAALARATYLQAVSAVIFAGHLAHSPGPRDVAGAARRAPPAPLPRAPDLLLDALAVRLTDGYAASTPLIERVLRAFCDDDVSVEEALRWLLLAGVIAADLWDHERWHLVTTRHVAIIRRSGALSELPLALDSSAVVHVFAGELAAAAALIDEVETVSAAIGSHQPPFGALALAAVRGREREARRLIDATISGAGPRGQGLGVTVARCHHAVLCNGLGRYEDALAAAQAAAGHQEEFGAPRWALAEVVEAAIRSGAPELAADALAQLAPATRAAGTDWALGVEARSRALVSDGDDAEQLYRHAIERLTRTRLRVELARTQLVYGEWLRRAHRRVDARDQLRAAHDLFSRIGAEAFAERARRELLATGETVRRLTNETRDALTPQETQIARLAARGSTNPEIGAQLFISPRTVEYHLRKVFTKLEVSSRKELRMVLAPAEADLTQA